MVDNSRGNSTHVTDGSTVAYTRDPGHVFPGRVDVMVIKCLLGAWVAVDTSLHEAYNSRSSVSYFEIVIDNLRWHTRYCDPGYLYSFLFHDASKNMKTSRSPVLPLEVLVVSPLVFLCCALHYSAMSLST